MNVPLYDAIGLRIYRELMHREGRAAADWRRNYGPEAIAQPPDPSMMVNLGKFSKFASVPMPLDVQLKAIKAERAIQVGEVDAYEKSTFPTRSDVPVSELSVKFYGEGAWHTQSKTDQAAPATYEAWKAPDARWTKRRWDVERIQYVREGLAPAHVHSRELAEGTRKAF